MSALVTPNGGWKFEWNKVIIIGDTFNNLVKNVVSHFMSNGIDEKNPEQLIMEQIKKNNPGYIFRIQPLMTIHGH